jgi:stage V sporulation protein G
VNITEVRVKMTDDKDDKLRAFCSITVDNEFVIRDLKVIEGSKGMFVAMPSRKLTARCPRCGEKNHLRASYCNGCGNKISSLPPRRDQSGRTKLHADIAHPINSLCRENIQSRVLDAYNEEVEHMKSPGYRPREIYDRSEVSVEDEAEAKPDEGTPGTTNDNFSEGLFQ